MDIGGIAQINADVIGYIVPDDLLKLVAESVFFNCRSCGLRIETGGQRINVLIYAFVLKISRQGKTESETLDRALVNTEFHLLAHGNCAIQLSFQHESLGKSRSSDKQHHNG